MAGRDNKVLWPVAAAFAVAVVGVCLAVFSSDPPTSLRTAESGGSSADTQPDATTKPYVFAAGQLCVAHGSVTITAVRPHTGRSLTVVDWATSDSSALPTHGLSAPGLAKDLRGFHGTGVTQSCAEPQAFAFSVRRTGAVGYARGIDVLSTAGTVTLPYTVALCAAASCPAYTSQPYSGTP